MATTIRWIDNSSVEQGHRIYKSDTYFTKDNLPPMLVELGPDVEEYVDEDGEDGENWYIVSAFIGDYEVFSEPFIAGLSTTFIHDIFGDGSAVATYRFDGDATDLGGNFDGTWSGTEQYDDGVIGQAARFNGSNSINAGYRGDSNQISISCWLNVNSGEDAGLFGFDKVIIHDSSGGDLVVFDTPNGTGSLRRSTGIWSDMIGKGFFHFTVSIENQDIRVYVNGVERDVNFSSSSFSGNYGGGIIGNDGRPVANFGGIIDQFRIFNRALTEEEVQALYQEGAAFL